MPTLSQSSVNQVIGLNRLISEIDSVDDLRKEALRRMEDIFHAPCSTFLLRPQGSPIATFDRYIARGLPEDFPRTYSYRAFILDPFARTLMSQPGIELVPEVRTGSEIVSYRELPESAFYWKYMRPFNIYHMLRMELVINNRSIATLGLFRPESASDFSEGDSMKAMLSVSTLANALDRAIQKENYQENFSLLESNASTISQVGLLILDEHLNLLYCDANAQDWCAQLAGNSINSRHSPSMLPAGLASHLSDFQHRLQKEACVDKLEQSVSVLAGKSAAQAYIRVQKTIYGRWRILVYLLPDEQALCPINRLLRFGISNREAEVVQLVVTGLRNYEIAERLSISLNTVQSHLNKVFRKLGVRSRSELIFKVTKPGNIATLHGTQ